MDRRKSLKLAALTGALPLAHHRLFGRSIIDPENELYELRTYEMTFGSSHNLLIDYLNEILGPAMEDRGANHFVLIDETGGDEPRKIWVLISYPSPSIYIHCQALTSDQGLITRSSEYVQKTIEKKVYNRYSSMLLSAFDGMKLMQSVNDQSSLLELRIYEGQNDDAVRRKIEMFDNEEIDLFLRVGLHPVFFGNLISGPYRPALVYMLQFKDIDERKANWAKFVAHPDWNTMKVKPEYANSVSNIRKIFLKPI